MPNTLQSAFITSPYDKEEECSNFLVENIDDSFLLTDLMSVDTEYTFTCWVKSDAAGSITFDKKTFDTTSKWTKQIIIFTSTGTDFSIRFGKTGSYYIYHPKLELGNIPSDWTPNPEDIEEDVDTNTTRISVSESTIKQLSDMISTIVVDENGSSMMTQTSEGWSFNIGGINSQLNKAAESLNNLSGSLEQANNTINNLNTLVNDVSKKTAYINIGADSTGAPCIELGKEDNPFKVRITNTSIDFIDNFSTVAYINNQKLFIETAVIKNELQIGEGTGFIFKRRSNGNLGLRWVG